jgi:NAD(P)-dependent dehydrogenase (short-subunit alcohol dehydrogenase family)
MKSGWTVFPLVRSQSDARILLAEHPERCYPIVGDVGRNDVEPAIRETLESKASSLDLLVNNAGHLKKLRGLEQAVDADLIEAYEVHCLGALRCTRAALPFLRKGKNPIIVNITSRRGTFKWVGAYPVPSVYSYQIAKCAQNMLTLLLHQELKETGVSVLAVHPGQLLTAVAPSDADTKPQTAAQRFIELIGRVNSSFSGRCYDLMRDDFIDF